MFMVIFEVQPHKERFDDYLEIAKSLKPHIEKIDGFIDNERYSSKRREGRVLSLSTWRDEKAVIRWRTLAVHHQAQEKGEERIRGSPRRSRASGKKRAVRQSDIESVRPVAALHCLK